ncbi:SDR family NAD(P)-dependent oxidoreductase [Neotabrizicola sp. VNH66]|uniref:SDR family NAD(P)-dependent oxidoreductase n=1 Tax=Neotabrizicola sp. VNH66 TaxID=3400918 RepID=UPI003BFCF96A
MRLEGRRALITGGTSGIGLALAQVLAARGVRVVVTGRDAARAEAVAATLPGAEAIGVDLARPDDQDRLVAEVGRRWPDLAILVNNAGVQVNMPPVGLGDSGLADALRDEVALNLAAPAILTLGLMPVLAGQPGAVVVNISSGLAIAPKRTAPVYCATKAGLRSLTRGLRLRCQVAAPGIRLVDVVMAYVDTPMTAGRPGRKLTAESAAVAVTAGLERDLDVIWIGKTRILSLLDRLAPPLAARIMRGG